MKRLMLAVSMMCALAVPAPLRAAERSELAETKAEYMKKAHAELDELGAKIDALELRAKKARSSAHEDVQQKLKDLKARRKAAKKDLAKLKRASAKAWAELKTGVDKSIEDLKKEFDEASKNYFPVRDQ